VTPPTSAVTAQASTALGGGFFNAMCVSDEDPAWVTLHGAGWALGGGDIWGAVTSDFDPNITGSPRGGLRYWRGSNGKMSSAAVNGCSLSHVTAGRGYLFHGTGQFDPKNPTKPPSGGAVSWTSDYGLSWTTKSAGGATNYQGGHPRGVGRTVLTRAVAGKDQVILASFDGIYVSQDVTASAGPGLSKVALGTAGSNVGGRCVGLDRDPNNPDIIYVAVVAPFAGSTLKPGVYAVTVTSSGNASAPTLLGGQSFGCQEVVAINEGGKTAVYGVGKGGVFRFTQSGGSWTASSFMGGLPTADQYASVDGFYTSSTGKTTLVVGYMGGAPQMWWTQCVPGAKPTWVALDTAARTSPLTVYGQPDSEGYWCFGPNGKAGAFKMGSGHQFVPSQIIALPKGTASANIFVCGRTTIYELPDANDPTSDWRVCGKGTNATEAHFVSASPAGGGKFMHGDADFLLTTTSDGYSGAQPRIHSPWNLYVEAPISYDEKGGVYTGGSPAGKWSNTSNGQLSYHANPHGGSSYPAGAAANGWHNYKAPGSTDRVIGAFGFWTGPNTRVLLCVVYKNAAYRRVDTVTGRDSNGFPNSWNEGTWAPVPNLCAGVTGGVQFARGATGSIYVIDKKRGLCRSDDNGQTFPVIDGGFTGSIDNDPAAGDRLALTKGSSVWLINDAKGAPGTKSQIDGGRTPNCGPVAFDRDPAYRTSGKSRLWICNNGSDGKDPGFWYTDDPTAGTVTWKASGGAHVGSEIHVVADMAASAGYVVTASYHGGLKTMVPGSASTDTTPPSPNPITGLAGTATDSRTISATCDDVTDPSGIDFLTWKAFTALTGGSAVATVTTGDTAATITVPTGGTDYYLEVTATDAAGTPHTTNPQATRVGPVHTPADPTGDPVPAFALTDNGDGTATGDITGASNYTGTVHIVWGDGAADDLPVGQTSMVHTYASTGTFIGSATFFNPSNPTTGVSASAQVTVTGSNNGGGGDDGGGGGTTGNGTDHTADKWNLPYLVSGDNLLEGNSDDPNQTGFALKDRFNELVDKLAAALTTLDGGTPAVGTEAIAWAVGGDTGAAGATSVSPDTPLPTTIPAGTKAYAVHFCRVNTATFTDPAGWTVEQSVANGGGGRIRVLSMTLGTADQGTTPSIAVATGGAQFMGLIIFAGNSVVTGLDGAVVATSNGATVGTSHPSATGSTTASNEIVVLGVGVRHNTNTGREVTPPAGATPIYAVNTTAGDGGTTGDHNVAIALWAVTVASPTSVPAQTATTADNSVSVGVFIPLAHA
jgi:hypothetical protein